MAYLKSRLVGYKDLAYKKHRRMVLLRLSLLLQDDDPRTLPSFLLEIL